MMEWRREGHDRDKKENNKIKNQQKNQHFLLLLLLVSCLFQFARFLAVRRLVGVASARSFHFKVIVVFAC